MAKNELTIRERVASVLPKGSKLLIAVSGGLDSICLLHICGDLASELDLDLGVAHVNHGLRSDSEQDAEFVESTVSKLSVPFHLHTVQDEIPVANIESWARNIRYSFFKALVSEGDYDYVVTAHTASDLAETFLMRILANKEPRPILGFDERRSLIRPLLDVFRSELDSYQIDNNLEFRNDSSNEDERFYRNKIRNSIIPHLSNELDRGVERILYQQAIAYSKDISSIELRAEALLENDDFSEFGSRSWLNQLKLVIEDADEGLRHKLVQLALYSKLRFNLGRDHTQRFCQFLKSGDLAIQIPGGVTFRRKNGGLIVESSPSG